MKLSLKLLVTMSAVMLLMSGCAQKVKIKALNPAEVSEMATKKKVAINNFNNDKHGLSGKIESKIAKHKLDKKKYFTVLSRRDLQRVIAEQKLQSSELMDDTTAARIGKLVGAQAIINGEIASSTAVTDKYLTDRKECIRYVKNQGCVQYRYYKVTCNTIQAAVSANINIVDVETGSMLYGDVIDKEYNADSCKRGKVLSKGQALNRLTTQIASEFVYKLTPNYIYFYVKLLDEIELENVTTKQEVSFNLALTLIEAGRMYKAQKRLWRLNDRIKGKSYVVAYVLGVTYEAQGKLDDAKKYYTVADDLTVEPIDEINSAIIRIDKLIEKNKEAKQQIKAKS